MKRELEKEFKNECFLSQMKRERLKVMEDFLHNEDWSYENDENGNMVFFHLQYNVRYRVGSEQLIRSLSSHTTVRTVRYTAVS